MGKPFLSLILPAYNEARAILGTLNCIQSYLADRGWSYELIVAADGDDGTREKVGQRAMRDPRLQVLGTAERGGKGRGIRQAVARATGDIIGFADADNKTPIEDFDKLLPWFDQGADIVIGSRALADTEIENPAPFHRRIGSRFFALGMRTIVGLYDIGDTQCGFKFFRHDVAKQLFAQQRIDGYMFDVEILHLARRHRYRVQEVGVRWRGDNDSRLQLLSGNWRNFLDLLRIRFGAYPQQAAASAEQREAGQMSRAA